MTREVLPFRRHAINHEIEYGGATYTVGIGFNDDFDVREIFMNGAKIGSDIEALLDDACILSSLLLQSGMSAAELSEKLSREAPDPTAPAASVIGLALRVAKTEEKRIKGSG